ncbi:hypothetical protein LOZ53_004915 [Ophidiomyces ophidiicola]|nr:hypothetical protein LOZ55_001097 [Ophidiomyces ophidiicola]KAI1985779.1 hypothetical protein LOZ53_004915 [Ophidiomyces ophidiicola]KAI1995552.1 hypothetical protein LOZ51_003378 [Ophidiomyces ophidiicola]KAI1996109.1 hypothetical protein LOZ54_000405 [Ophidiomyces ophidiicola]
MPARTFDNDSSSDGQNGSMATADLGYRHNSHSNGISNGMTSLSLDNAPSKNSTNGAANGNSYYHINGSQNGNSHLMIPMTTNNASPIEGTNGFSNRGLKSKSSRYFNRRANGDMIIHTNGHSSGILDDYDIDAVRDSFPGTESKTIALNNAGGSLVHRGVIESVIRSMSTTQLDLHGGDIKSDHDRAGRASRYKELASFMNAEPDEIAFGPSTTSLLRTLSDSLRPLLNSNSEIIVSMLCHEGNVTPWVALANSLGITIKWWMPAGGPGNTNAQLSVETLKPLLSPKTRLVTCGHVSNIFGTIHKIREVADLVHTIPGAMLCVDGVAWAPHRPIDVKALDVDFYVFSWYKVFGPHLAQMYARRGIQQRHLSSLHHYPFHASSLDLKFHLGNNCFELEDSLIPIVRYINQVGWDKIIAFEEHISRPLVDYLLSHPEVYTLYGEQTLDSNARVPLISFTVNGMSSKAIASEIHNTSNFRIAAGTCYSFRPVHDILRLGDEGVLRVSPAHYNTLEDVEAFVEVLDQVVRSKLRNCTTPY